jgi:hypothetical protein
MTRVTLEPWIHAPLAGATAGALAEVLVMRLNPELEQSGYAVILGLPLWVTWGAVGAGLPILLGVLLARRLGRVPGSWPAPSLTALVYLVAAVMSRVNADLHPEFLPVSGHRILRQDAVAWLVAALLALAAGAVVRRLAGGPKARAVFAVVAIVLPAVRLLGQPTPPLAPLDVAARPLGVPERPLLVLGIEGLDSTVILADAADGRYQSLSVLATDGAWGPLAPYQPFLRQSLWTSTATGTTPGRHGVKAHWGWKLPWLEGEPLRLLPWTPQGSRLILPWGLGERVVPPPSTVPPLWERIRASGVRSAAYGWPGIWGPGVGLEAAGPRPRSLSMDEAMRRALARALEPFERQREEVWRAVERDQVLVDDAARALEQGSRDVWLHLEALSATRRELEPLKAMHTREREVRTLVLELLDEQLATLLAAAGKDALVVVVSPYGLAPPSPWERLRRLIGIGDDWRTSAEGCPDGVLMLFGRGVLTGERLPRARVTDVAPTICYLLGLPVAQSMDGGVVVEGIDPGFLADHPLRVVD